MNFGDASIVVPKAWTVLPPGGTLCADHLVQLGAPGTKSSCSTPPGQGKLTTITMQALPSDFSTTAWPKATAQYLNGHRVVRLTPETMGVTQGTVQYAVRDLGVELSVSGAGTEEIIGSIDWSDRYVALATAKAHAGTSPKGWTSAGFKGVRFAFPASMAVDRLDDPHAGKVDPGACERSPAVQPSTVSEGSAPAALTATLRCPFVPPFRPVELGVDGVWIHAAAASEPQVKATSLPGITAGDAVILDASDEAGAPFRPVLVVSLTRSDGKRLLLNVGLGPDPTIAGQIIASLRVD